MTVIIAVSYTHLDVYKRQVKLNPECLVAEDMFWQETEYRSNFNVKPVEMHHTAGPQH